MEADADAEDDDEMEGFDAGPPSPSSSGYAAKRGSSLASSGGIDEREPEGHAAGAEDWARDKRHLDEDDASASWRKRKKHFFILNNSCKPIYSRYGDEHKLAGFSATLQAIISFIENSGDHIKFVRAGKQQDIADSGVLFALLMCEHKVITLVGVQKATLYPDDMLLLANFIVSSESFRISESFSPICLPRYNHMAFLYAYIHFFDEHTYLILLTTRSDDFYDLKDSRACIQNVLLKSNVLVEVQRSLRESALHVEDLPIHPSSRSASPPPESSQDMNSQSLSSEMAIGGLAGLWHFIYKSIYLDQYVSSEFASPISNPKQQKRCCILMTVQYSFPY